MKPVVAQPSLRFSADAAPAVPKQADDEPENWFLRQLFHIRNWLSELLSGLFRDLKLLLKGANQEEPHVHGPGCGHHHPIATDPAAPVVTETPQQVNNAGDSPAQPAPAPTSPPAETPQHVHGPHCSHGHKDLISLGKPPAKQTDGPQCGPPPASKPHSCGPDCGHDHPDGHSH
jgi:hypothetical protein